MGGRHYQRENPNARKPIASNFECSGHQTEWACSKTAQDERSSSQKDRGGAKSALGEMESLAEVLADGYHYAAACKTPWASSNA